MGSVKYTLYQSEIVAVGASGVRVVTGIATGVHAPATRHKIRKGRIVLIKWVNGERF